jgi:hypothetical protein
LRGAARRREAPTSNWTIRACNAAIEAGRTLAATEGAIATIGTNNVASGVIRTLTSAPLLHGVAFSCYGRAAETRQRLHFNALGWQLT